MANLQPNPLSPDHVDVPLTPAHPPITLRSPAEYNPKLSSSTQFVHPSNEWMEGTWSVTHSTPPMWRKARNVRITYKILPKATDDLPDTLDDEVTSEPAAWSLMPQRKSIKGIDTSDGKGGWDWRGKWMLRVASSH